MWRTDNPIPRLFRPRPSQTVRIERDAQGQPTAVLVFDPVLSDQMREGGLPVPAVAAHLLPGTYTMRFPSSSALILGHWPV